MTTADKEIKFETTPNGTELADFVSKSSAKVLLVNYDPAWEEWHHAVLNDVPDVNNVTLLESTLIQRLCEQRMESKDAKTPLQVLVLLSSQRMAETTRKCMCAWVTNNTSNWSKQNLAVYKMNDDQISIGHPPRSASSTGDVWTITYAPIQGKGRKGMDADVIILPRIDLVPKDFLEEVAIPLLTRETTRLVMLGPKKDLNDSATAAEKDGSSKTTTSVLIRDHSGAIQGF